MSTFILKKYEEKKQPSTETEEKEAVPSERDAEKEMTIEVSGSVSEIIANALNKVFANTNVEIEEVKEDGKAADAEAITMEDIRNDPVKTLRAVKQSKAVVITGEGFKTKEDEWFATNMEDYDGKVFYSVEKFIDFIADEFRNTDGQ